MYNIYLGDANENETLSWLIENIGPLALTTKKEFAYFNTYHGQDDLWVMDTTDVSDVSSSRWDEITHLQFKTKEDAMLFSIRFGGSIQ